MIVQGVIESSFYSLWERSLPKLTTGVYFFLYCFLHFPRVLVSLYLGSFTVVTDTHL